VVEKVRYLGAVLTSEGTDDDEIWNRASKSSQMFGMLRALMASKDVHLEVKRRTVLGLILPAMLDGAETWVVSAAAKRHLQTTYRGMVRSCFRVNMHTTRKWRISTQSLLGRLHLEPLEHYLQWRALGYAGHVSRMPQHRLPKMITGAVLHGPKMRGGQPLTYDRQIQRYLKDKGIEGDEWETLAQNKTKWREAIRSQSVSVKMRKKISARVQDIPTEKIGKWVEKKYQGKWYAGVITECNVCATSGDHIWRVKYDDDDISDYNARQLQEIFVGDLGEILE
jgi:hypothetical protein